MGLQEADPAGRDRSTALPFVQWPPQERGVSPLWRADHRFHHHPGSQATQPARRERSHQAGELPHRWEDNPARLRQKDQDARWTKKNQVSHYGYKNSISIDATHGLIRSYEITPANVHDSQMLPALLDGDNSTPIMDKDA